MFGFIGYIEGKYEFYGCREYRFLFGLGVF